MDTHISQQASQRQPGMPDVPALGLMDERTAHLLHTVRVIIRTMLHARDEEALLLGLCRNIIEDGCFQQVGIAFAEGDDGKRIRWAAWLASDGHAIVPVDVAPLNALQLSLDDPCASGSAIAIAMRTRQPCLRQPLFAGTAGGDEQCYPDACVRHTHLDEITALPMLDEGVLLGALFVAAPKPGIVEEDSLRFLATLADDMAQGILAARLRDRHEAAQRVIERLAFYDTLTSLPNRTRYLIHLQERIDRATAEGYPLALLHIKLIKLAEICEVLGHAAAEHLVSQTTERLRRLTGPDQALARIADANFALLLRVTSADAAMDFANTLAQHLGEAVEIDGITVDTPVHVGIALHGNDPIPARELDRRAESALRHGGSAVRLYVCAKDKENTTALALAGDLQRTIEGQGLELYCQPKVDMRSGQVMGAEALVRWRHAQHGDIPPSRFIRLAESSDMISQLTAWLLQAARARLLDWQEAGLRCPLAINLSAHDLQNQALMKKIEEFAGDGIDPSLVQFELTESVLIDDPAMARHSLDRLKQLGFELAIDDFGTGFSGLSYLQNFPVDCIKIDQSFVMPMLKSASAEAIVRSTIDLGHQLGHTIIAEGIEDRAVWARLRSYGCDLAQGYLIAKPMPALSFPEWAAAWNDHRDWQDWDDGAAHQTKGWEDGAARQASARAPAWRRRNVPGALP